MANAAGFIRESIWRDDDWRKLSRTAQALYMQLLSQKDLDCAGVLPLQTAKWAKGCAALTEYDLIWDLQELQNGRFVFVDDDTDEAFIRTYMRNSNVLKVPNMMKSALRSARLVASEKIRAELALELVRTGRPEAVAVAAEINPSGTLPEPLANPSGTLPKANPSVRVSEPFRNPSGTLPEPSGVGVGEVSTKSSVTTNSPLVGREKNRGTRLDPNWMPKPSTVDAIKAETNATKDELSHQHRKFVDYWTDKTGRDATKLSWDGTWRNWMRTAHERGEIGKKAGTPAPNAKPHKLRALADLAAEVREMETANGKAIEA